MTTTDRRIQRSEDTAGVVGPERLAGQGLDEHQHESGDRAIRILLSDPVVGPQTDLVITCRDGAYEVWAARGMVRFVRRYAEHGRGPAYSVIEQIGENPIARQDPRALATIDDEVAASRASGFPAEEPSLAYVDPAYLTYPLAYERIAQLFDSPNAPDLVVNPKAYLFGAQPGQHGALDVVQSRSPLIFAGPGIARGVTTDALSRQIDIAPTIAKRCGFPLIDGADETGRTSGERGVAPDVYLKRQDGRPLDAIIEAGAQPAERAYIFLLDGLSNADLTHRLGTDADGIPNLRRLVREGAMFEYGSFTNFPSITWPSHNAIGTGAWGGHHDIVNPTYYLRPTRELVTPQGQQFETARFLGDGVETLYEAFHRVFGDWHGHDGAFTASIHEPCTRGADHATLERAVIGDRDRLRDLTAQHAGDSDPKWQQDGQRGAYAESVIETRGLAQVLLLYTDASHPPPKFMFHEMPLTDGVGHDYGPHSDGVRAALDETDRRIGHILRMLEEQGLYDGTLFVITTDHGMAATDAAVKADQTRAVIVAGMKAVACPPFVYLLDMAVTVTAHPDGRTAMVEVLANDADASGQRPPVAGAAVTLSGHDAEVLARATTSPGGTCGLPLPVSIEPAELVVTVHHEDYNRRHLRLDGSPVQEDLRDALYGGR
ncbi:MAG: alkaline phosphatase family protein [Dehalococcoidia bacterium]|nr:alkaline phosphatase family protein [Dehalococcoidia bacterium]